MFETSLNTAIAQMLLTTAGGIFVSMLLGIAGALVAGFIGRLLGLYPSGQQAGFIMSTLGAVLLLALYRLITHRHSHV